MFNTMRSRKASGEVTFDQGPEGQEGGRVKEEVHLKACDV